MSAEAARILLALGAAYGTAGLVVALLFLFRDIERAAPAARGAHAFRPLVLPGLILLWPVVLWRTTARH